jgi:hypothetical protein
MFWSILQFVFLCAILVVVGSVLVTAPAFVNVVLFIFAVVAVSLIIWLPLALDRWLAVHIRRLPVRLLIWFGLAAAVATLLYTGRSWQPRLGSLYLPEFLVHGTVLLWSFVVLAAFLAVGWVGIEALWRVLRRNGLFDSKDGGFRNGPPPT